MTAKQNKTCTPLSTSKSVETLAGHIAAVLSHPLTPVTLYNAIADELTDMESLINRDSPEMIAKGLIAYEQREQQRKGGE